MAAKIQIFSIRQILRKKKTLNPKTIILCTFAALFFTKYRK